MEITGLDELITFVKNKTEIAPEVEKSVKDCAILLKDEMINNSPADIETKQISVELNQLNSTTFEIGQSEEDASNKNFGYRTKDGYVEGQHQVTDAVEKVRSIFNSRMERVVKE